MHFGLLSTIWSCKHPQSPILKTKNKIVDSRFGISNQSDIEQLKENSKNQNTLKATQTWLKVWQNSTTERKVNQKIEARVRA